MKALVISALLLFAPAASAQLKSAVGPPVAPVGCPISVSISNDTSFGTTTGICYYEVKDASGALVFTFLACPQIAVFVPPGATYTLTWDQRDVFGVQVPPGRYQVEVKLPTGSVETTTIRIDADAEAAAAYLGVPKIGTQRNLRLCAPQDPSRFYFLGAAFAGDVGIPTCGGVVPLNPDGLLSLSTNPSNPSFLSFSGFLDEQGESTDPAISIPGDTAFVGAAFQLAFVAVDFAQPCPFVTVSEALPVLVE